MMASTRSGYINGGLRSGNCWSSMTSSRASRAEVGGKLKRVLALRSSRMARSTSTFWKRQDKVL